MTEKIDLGLSFDTIGEIRYLLESQSVRYTNILKTELKLDDRLYYERKLRDVERSIEEFENLLEMAEKKGWR